MKLSSKARKIVIVSGLALALAACSSIQSAITPSQISYCKPVAPQLEWYEVGDNEGIYYPNRSVENLMIYIEQLNDCIDYYNVNPG